MVPSHVPMAVHAIFQSWGSSSVPGSYPCQNGIQKGGTEKIFFSRPMNSHVYPDKSKEQPTPNNTYRHIAPLIIWCRLALINNLRTIMSFRCFIPRCMVIVIVIYQCKNGEDTGQKIDQIKTIRIITLTIHRVWYSAITAKNFVPTYVAASSYSQKHPPPVSGKLIVYGFGAGANVPEQLPRKGAYITPMMYRITMSALFEQFILVVILFCYCVVDGGQECGVAVGCMLLSSTFILSALLQFLK